MLNQYIDHTNLKANATIDDIAKLCQEAIDHNFYAVCVNGNYLHHALDLLSDSDVHIAVVAGFPLGSNTLNAKLNEISLLVDAGADEIDMVLNIGYMKSGLIKDIEAELAMSRVIAEDVCLKLILETCYLTDEEIVAVSKLALKQGFGVTFRSLETIRILWAPNGAPAGIATEVIRVEFPELAVPPGNSSDA